MEPLFIKDAAKEIGVAPITLKRWLLSGKVRDVTRDRNGWRIFTTDDIRRIKQHEHQTHEPSEELYLPGLKPKDHDKGYTFRDSAFNGNKKLPFHRWVPWIAGFSAEFVEDCFYKYLSNKSDTGITVLDPFAGVGTTLVEGFLHGFNIVGFEINPYAYLACKVKLSANRYDIQAVEKVLNNFIEFYRKREADETYTPRTPVPVGFNTRVPFYSPSVEKKVLVFFDFLANIKNIDIRDLFKVAFGTVMVSFSNYSYEPSLGRRSSSGKPDIEDAEVGDIIASKIRSMINDLEEFEEFHADTAKDIDSKIYNRSFFLALDVCESDSIDLLITSPPYLNNYHYLRNTRPQLQWLSLADDKVLRRAIENESFGKYWQTVRDQDAIGLTFELDQLNDKLEVLRQTNPQKGVYGGQGWANYAATYFNDSFRFCKIVKKLLKPAGVAIVVIGNSILQGIEIKTDEIFADIGELAGLKKKEIILLRSKRTGSSIIDSTVRAGKTEGKPILYETAVVLTR